MKEETLKELDRINNKWTHDLARAYGMWCCSVLSTLYTELDPGDKVHIVVHQPHKNRPELKLFAHPETECVLLNITMGAVIGFGMDYEGVTFECALHGKPLRETYLWEEIVAFEVRVGGYVKYQIPLNPDEMTVMTTLMLETKQVVGEVTPPPINTTVPVSNVVQLQFGQKA